MSGRSRLLLLCMVAAGLAGCANGGPFDFREVRPWERGTLAKDAMRLDGDPVDSYVNEHIYFSKEATTGGSGVGAGGCGCN